MRYTEVMCRLEALHVDIKVGTLRRWASEEIITPPVRIKRSRGKKLLRGRTMDWPEESVAEAAAVWAVRRHITKGIKKIAPSRTLIPYIKHSVSHVYESPTAAYTLPSGITDPSWRVGKTYKSIKMTLTYDKYKAVSDEYTSKEVPQPAYITWESLVTTWICAIEKAKHQETIWPIDKPATVILHWKRRELDDHSWTHDFSHTTLDICETGGDAILFYVDGVDMREEVWNMMKQFRL